MTSHAATALVRHIARALAEARGRLRCHREWPAAHLLTPEESAATVKEIVEHEAGLTALDIPPERWPDLADIPTRPPNGAT